MEINNYTSQPTYITTHSEFIDCLVTSSEYVDLSLIKTIPHRLRNSQGNEYSTHVSLFGVCSWDEEKSERRWWAYAIPTQQVSTAGKGTQEHRLHKQPVQGTRMNHTLTRSVS